MWDTFSPTKICRTLVNVAIPEGFHLNYDTSVNNKRQKMLLDQPQMCNNQYIKLNSLCPKFLNNLQLHQTQMVQRFA